MKKNHLTEWGAPLTAAAYILALGLFTTGCGGGGGGDSTPTSVNSPALPAASFFQDGTQWGGTSFDIISQVSVSGAAGTVDAVAFSTAGNLDIQVQNMPTAGVTDITPPATFDPIAPALYVCSSDYNLPTWTGNACQTITSGTVTSSNNGTNITFDIVATFTDSLNNAGHTFTGSFTAPLP